MNVFWGGITVTGYVLTLVLIPWVILRRKSAPVSTVAWIMVIIILPYIGGLLFLVFGVNRAERRASEKQEATRVIGKKLPELRQYQFLPSESRNPQHARLMRLATQIGDTLPTVGNRIELLVDTNRALGLIEQAILSARETLHLEYYIWQPDRTGTRIRDLLIRKAKEGVVVRFLYDGIGSLHLSKKFLQPMRDAGIHVASFLPGKSWRRRWSLNLRNHRKIVIVDGRVGFTGGMNIGDEYHGRNRHIGYWRDTHLKLLGPTVLQLQQVFAEDWYFATDEILLQPETCPPTEESGNLIAQVLSGQPAGDVYVFHALLFAAINEAQKRVTLSTSYFVPPEPLVMALETAAYRGVRVRLLLAGRSAYHWTVLAGRSYYEPLLKAGVEIFEYERGLLHAKTLTVDGNWSLVGTPNFDVRSLMLNFEVAVAVYDSKFTDQLDEQVARDVQLSKRIELAKFSQRSIVRVLGENVCRLFAPVL